MDTGEIRKLIHTRKPALIEHALNFWEKEHKSDSEILLTVLDYAEADLIDLALKLAAKYHPGTCASAIASLLSNPDPRVRRLSVQSLNEKMANECSKPLIELLANETDVFVLASAANAAAKLRLEASYLELCLKHQDIRVRANAVRAVAICSPERIYELLEPMLRDKALRVQNEALKALAQFIPENDLEQLIAKRLRSKDPSVRAATVFITGDLPISLRLTFLIEALADKDTRVINNAARSLTRINNPAGVRSVVEIYFKTAEQSLANNLLKQFNEEHLDIFKEQAEKAGKPGKLLCTTLIRIVTAAKHFANWEPLLPWIMAAVDSDESEARLAALHVVLHQILFFSNNIERMLEKAQASGNSRESALVNFIRWKSGNTSGLEKLKQMLFAGLKDDIAAVSELLNNENSILARNILAEAGKRGIYIASDQKSQPTRPITLPDA